METNQMISLHEGFFEEYGFVLDPDTLHYTKLFAEGKQLIFFHHVQNPDANYIEYQLGIRFDAVEKIINEFLPSLGDFKERSVTHIATLDQINQKMSKRYFLEDDFEINEIFKKMEVFFIEEGFEWLDFYSIPQNLENLFNKNPDQELTTQNFTYRSARAITLCKLYNESEYENTKKAYLGKLEEMMVTPFTLATFLNLLGYLEDL
ncbi:hypothetical protein ACFSKL_15170 [Belliella marina]|uniref:Uncharacterized protein n=1 Tax=Belliella marina TaxID=1644146 RepID=A0ABW4VPJ6_9BACT